MFQHFLSNPIPKLPQGEVAPCAVNHMLPIAPLHCQVGLKTAVRQTIDTFQILVVLQTAGIGIEKTRILENQANGNSMFNTYI